MSSPMFDVGGLGDHIYIPVNKNGDGPAEIEETVRWVCWCPDVDDCLVNPPVKVPD